MGGQPLNAPVVDMAPTPDGTGYWLVASDGGIFAFGDAAFHGSMGGHHLNAPVVGMAADGATGGYWLVGYRRRHLRLRRPLPRLDRQPASSTSRSTGWPPRPTAAATGWWPPTAASSPSATPPSTGSTGGMTLNAPVVGMAADPATGGYWLVGADGGVFAFGAPFFGAGLTGARLGRPGRPARG